jgi:hypothetical protein
MHSSSNSNKKKAGSAKRLSRRPSRRVSISLNQLLGNSLEGATENGTNSKKKRKANARRSTVNLRALKEGVALKNEKEAVVIDPQDVVETVKILEDVTLKNEKEFVVIDPQDVVETVNILDEDLVGEGSNVNDTNDCDNKLHQSVSSYTAKQAIKTSIDKKTSDTSSDKPSEQIDFINPLLQPQAPSSTPGCSPDKRDAEPVEFINPLLQLNLATHNSKPVRLPKEKEVEEKTFINPLLQLKSNASIQNTSPHEEKKLEPTSFTNPLLELQSSTYERAAILENQKSMSPKALDGPQKDEGKPIEDNVISSPDDKYDIDTEEDDSYTCNSTPTNSRMNIFKQQPSIVLTHHSRTPIKEEPGIFKVNVVKEASELPSNTPRNNSKNNITDSGANASSKTNRFTLNNANKEQKNDSSEPSDEAIILSKTEIEKELDHLKRKLQLLDLKIEKAGIARTNENSNQSPPDRKVKVTKETNAKTNEAKDISMVQNYDDRRAKITTNLDDSNMLTTKTNIMRPLRPGGSIKSNATYKFTNKYNTKSYFNDYGSNRTTENVYNHKNNTDKTFTSKLINNEIVSLNDMDNQNIEESIHAMFLKNNTPKRNANISTARNKVEMSPTPIIKTNEKFEDISNHLIGGPRSQVLLTSKPIQVSSPLIKSAMNDSEKFIAKLEKRMCVESKMSSLESPNILRVGVGPMGNDSTNSTSIGQRGDEVDDANVGTRDDLDDQVQRILTNRRNRVNNKYNREKATDSSATKVVGLPLRRIHINRSGSIAIGHTNGGFDKIAKGNTLPNTPSSIRGNSNGFIQPKYEWAHLDVHSSNLPSNTSRDKMYMTGNTSKTILPFQQKQRAAIINSHRKEMQNKAKTAGIHSYQMRRSLPVLGVPDAMQVTTVHELVDPVLKGSILQCLTEYQKNNPKNPSSVSSWIAAECTFWLAPNLCELQWNEISSGNGGTIPLENVISVEKVSMHSPNYSLAQSNRVIDSSSVLILTVISPDDVRLILHLAAPNESIRDDWWGGLLYCRSVASFAAVKRKYKNK